ncbi:MAG TPA: tRNA pseudouridine(38-40) synthase TruA [Burkholderiales bacterium]|jgi:tRNA pseudouridine38-40 synthase|nr:tRNA pseudouridine(38-40) synthase TruA [Burkholderiales bacterium]
MPRIALGLEYDGAPFCGWQTQPGGCSVQDALERALSAIAGHRVEAVCAGRTDAGVHALHQVVHFDTDARRPHSAWVRGVNSLLPGGVCVLWAREVNEAFHARYCATSRGYTYYLLNRPERPALFATRVGWFHRPLDVELMREAARHLCGEHDFSAFRSAECQARNPVRTLIRLDIERRGPLVRFDLCANAFLHHMVRNVVGSLVYVGSGRKPARWVLELLESRDRRLAAPTFPALGLYLSQVEYPAHWSLPAAPPIDALESILTATG